MGFFALLVGLIWAKSILAYLVDFNLGIENTFQYFILFLNPFATTILLLSIALYVRKPLHSYLTMLVIYIGLSVLIYANASYYREFTDFITINTMLGAGAVSSGLGESALRLLRPHDILYFLDVVLIPVLLILKKIKIDPKPLRARVALAFSVLGALLFSANLSLAEADRPQLLGRTFSRDYMVKYLGLNFFTAYDGYQTYQTNQVRAEASPNDLLDVENYVDDHYAAPDENLFGLAEGKNVIYIHLESFQQFLIDYQLTDENGVAHTVTPFINSLYHDNQTFAFDNFFHQVKAGKTSDAETLMENSLFGLAQGSLFTQLGGKNTFEAAPNILKQEAGYTSAVFHGNAGTFWNRNETYKNLGFDYFFDASYYDVTSENSFQYGLHDKPFFDQSVQYLEHLQQPFYSKFIAVSNHYPYSTFENDDAGFPIADTGDETINGYFATANYLDTAVEEFFNYLKASGLYENSVIVLYGDHYGISDSRNASLAELLGQSAETWDNYDNANLQRVPYMIHIPGQTGGGISHTYGGQVDALPTLLHLLGVETDDYIQLGQDMLSPEHDQIVAFRDRNGFMTEKYVYYHNTLYYTADGSLVPEEEANSEQVQKIHDAVDQQLAVSDKINNGDLFRFYTDSGLEPIEASDFNYQNQLEQMETIESDLGSESTSLYSQNGGQSTMDLYQTKSYQEYLAPTTPEQ
ncbi:LTA synthase family protein [Enterococcus timonensis]|uniref:LTA synthase family protein n=1 Tax=Enterococcus timonensis TaxID=1852364 RepID=UPI0008DA89A3|nr:LTA synthase family protein [Enterococcus timonensis]